MRILQTIMPKKTPEQIAAEALQEAKKRRVDIDAAAKAAKAVREINGRGGAEPVRYGDWENNGIASDF